MKIVRVDLGERSYTVHIGAGLLGALDERLPVFPYAKRAVLIADANVVAFARGGRHVTVVPRLSWGLARAGGFGETTVELPQGRWGNLFTGEDVGGGRVPVAELTGRFPVALLEAR